MSRLLKHQFDSMPGADGRGHAATCVTRFPSHHVVRLVSLVVHMWQTQGIMRCSLVIIGGRVG
jgi:hypothetical protein